MLFEGDFLRLGNIADERARKVLTAAIDRVQQRMRPSDLIAAAIGSGDARILTALAQAMPAGGSPLDLRETIDVYNPPPSSPTDFDGSRRRISDDALAALDEFDGALAKGGEGVQRVALELLLSCVLRHLDGEDREYLSVFNAEQAAAQMAEQVKTAAEPSVPLFTADSGRLRSEVFTEGAWSALEQAGVRAADLGYDRILPPHFFLALLGETEGWPSTWFACRPNLRWVRPGWPKSRATRSDWGRARPHPSNLTARGSETPRCSCSRPDN